MRVEFIKSPNVALYDEADWSTLVTRVSDCSVERAQQIAQENPLIDFFFICRSSMVLTKNGTFKAGDALFFSGTPWYGSAPQCDSYQKVQFDVNQNAAQYDGADWSKLIKREANCTPERALEIAASDPKIVSFFFCRQPMSLPQHGNFSPGDAVFFGVEPWAGSAPQCDLYSKFRFQKSPNVALYDEADWSRQLWREQNCSLEKAAHIAAEDPKIDYFFIVRQPMVLPRHGTFSQGDAVFFSGNPVPGSAPQCDIYQKIRKSS